MLIRTLHWNIGGGKIRQPDADKTLDASYKTEGFDHLVEVIRRVQPDIVTLAETHANSDLVQAQKIGELAGLPFVRNETFVDSHVEAGQKLGMAVLSRFPITKHSFALFVNPGFIYMRSGKVAHDKGTLHATLDIGGRDIEVVVTHLTPFRRVNVDPKSPEAHTWLQDVAAKLMPTLPTVLMQGGFNINEKLLSPFLPELFSAGMQEVPAEEETTPAGWRYDHILYRGGKNLNQRVLSDALTDHYPVYAEFEL